MLELREMLKLRSRAREEEKAEPLIFPLFFTLTIEECKNGRLLVERYAKVFEAEGFFEASRQKTCSTREMIAAVDEVAGYPGLVYNLREWKTVQEFVQQAVLKVSKSFRLGLLNVGLVSAVEID